MARRSAKKTRRRARRRNPTDRLGRKYSRRKRVVAGKRAAKHRARTNRGRFKNPRRSSSRAIVRHSGRSRSRSQAAKHRRRDRFGHFLNPTEMAAFMNPGDTFYGPAFANPYDRLGRKYSKRKRVAAGKKAAKNRRRSHGRFVNPRRESRALVHLNRSRASRSAAMKRNRDRFGHFINPFDQNGYWHNDRGRYDHLPNRGGRHAAKRHAFAAGVAAGRSRGRLGRFENPSFDAFPNPAMFEAFAGSGLAFPNPRRAKTKGAEHRRRSKAAKKAARTRKRHAAGGKRRAAKRPARIRRGGAGSGARGGYMGRTIVMSRPYTGE